MIKLCSIVSFFLIILFTSCQTSNDVLPLEYDSHKVVQEIVSHDTTLIFVGTTWCQGSYFTFQKYVIPYLKQQHGNIGFVMFYFGDVEDIPSDIVQQNIVMITSSKHGLDKMVMNRRFKTLLRGYRRQNGVPVTLLVDREGNILNYLEAEKRYETFGEVVWKLEN